MKTIVIHQPDFIPYIGFFHRLLKADELIVLDHVRISKRGWVHRDKIKTANGEQWITIPVKKISQQPLIREAEVDYNDQYDKILRVIQANYHGAPCFDDIFPSLEEIIGRKPKLLIDLNLELLKKMMLWFDIGIAMTSSSMLGVETAKLMMNVDLIKAVGGTTYIAGAGSRNYHEDGPFNEANITVAWHEFDHPVYPQLFGEFIPFLSGIDLLFNCGIQKSRSIIRSC
jgi:hypothetical protein